MGYAEASTIIYAPVETVWDCLNDIDNTPIRVVGLEAAEITTPGPFGVGSVYHDHNRLGPFPQVTAWRITEFAQMEHQVHESTSAMLPSTMTLNLTPVVGGTCLQMMVDYRFLPQVGVLSRLFERFVMNRLLGQVLKQNQMRLNEHLQHNS